MSTPSIALIPSGYKSGKLYSQLPVNGDGDLTFARVGDATRVNENGLIEEMATGVPRLDYSDGGCPSLLVEPSSTNLIQYSEDFSQAYFTKFNLNINTDNSLSPNGSLSADLLTESVMTNSQSRFLKTLSILSGQDYTISFFVKDLVNRQLYVNFVATTNSKLILDSNFNSVVEQNINSYEVEDFTNGWKRVSFTMTSANTAGSLYVGFANNGSETYTADGSGSMVLWGLQLEEQPYATSYIPNNGNAAGETRDAETVSKSGLSDYINSSEGVLYLELSALGDSGAFENIAISDGTSNNRVFFFLSSIDNQIGFRVDVGGVIESSFSYNLTDFTEYFKFAVKYKENDVAFWVNGVEVYSDSSASVFNTSTLNRIGFDGGNGSGDFYGKVKDLRVYKTALTDTELQTLTS